MFIVCLHMVSLFNPIEIKRYSTLFTLSACCFTFCERHTLTEATNFSQKCQETVMLLVVVGPAGQARPRPTTLLPPRSYGKPEAAAAAVDTLLMTGKRMPETC